ncbi:hypothetical protein Tco_0646473 [Tanacetum coccineum]
MGDGWSSYKQFRIVLTTEDKLTYLEHHILIAPVRAPGRQLPPDVLVAHTHWVKASKENSCLVLIKSYIDNLERLGHPVSLGLAVSLILTSLSKEYDGFVQNYNMHGMGKTIYELHVMLKLHKQTLPKKDTTPAGKSKIDYAPKPNIAPLPKKDNLEKDVICHQCGEVDHWRRNCLVYLAELMKKNKQASGASTSGLKGSKKLKPRALNLYVGNGHSAAIEAIGSFNSSFPNDLVIVLDNYHYTPSITKGVISVSRLNDNGFVNCFETSGILVSKNNLLYFHVIPRDGIYEIDLHSYNSNDSSIYAISNKKSQVKLRLYSLMALSSWTP